MAADQPSINLAQAVQVMAYEFLVEALAERARLGEPLPSLDDPE